MYVWLLDCECRTLGFCMSQSYESGEAFLDESLEKDTVFFRMLANVLRQTHFFFSAKLFLYMKTTAAPRQQSKIWSKCQNQNGPKPS